jgi:hypothetical protein
MERVLDEKDIMSLRNKRLISNDEIALKVGDLFIAENIITRERRVLDSAGRILSETKRILKG